MTDVKLFKMTDERLLTAILAVAEKWDMGGDVRVRLRFHDNGELNVALKDVPTHPIVSSVRKAQSSVFVFLGVNGERATIGITRSSHGFDDLKISPPHNAPPEEQIQFILTVHQHLKPVDSHESVSRLLGEELDRFYAQREKGLLRLEELSETVLRRNDEYRARLDSERTDFQNKCEADFNAKGERQAHEHAAALAELETERKALVVKTKELDDRSSRHARRGHHKDLKKIIEDRSRSFSLTTSTRRKRLVLHGLFLAMIAAAASFLWWSLSPTQTPSEPWIQPLRIILGAVGLIGALVYYIRWNDQWFRQHADEELRLKRMELDIDRASWLVEMALEWKEEKQDAIPEELLERLSRNMFEERANGTVRHPAEDFLSTLLGSASALEVKAPFGGARFDRKGLKKLDSERRASE